MKKISRQYRWLIAIAALILSAIILATFQRPNLQLANGKKPAMLTIVPVSVIKKPLYVERTGLVEKSASIPVNADFTGLISELYVKEGQAVKTGDPLFTLKATEDSVIETTVSQPLAPSADAQESYENAQKKVTRLQKLYEIGGVSRREFEAAAASLQEAKENLNNPNSTQLTKTNGIAKNSSVTVTAPTSGIVTGLSSTDGGNVQAGQKLLSLGSGQEVEVVVHLSQNDLYLINLGAPTTVTAAQQTISGQIARIYPQIEAEQAPYFLAYIKLAENPANLLQAGMTVTAHIGAGQSTNASAIPTTAIYHTTQGQPFLYLSVDGKALLQQITLGETSGELTELTSSLPERSLIINGDIGNLKPGDDVAF